MKKEITLEIIYKLHPDLRGKSIDDLTAMLGTNQYIGTLISLLSQEEVKARQNMAVKPTGSARGGHVKHYKPGKG
jgi:hypothetical protein